MNICIFNRSFNNTQTHIETKYTTIDMLEKRLLLCQIIMKSNNNKNYSFFIANISRGERNHHSQGFQIKNTSFQQVLITHQTVWGDLLLGN